MSATLTATRDGPPLAGIIRLLRPWPGQLGADHLKTETYIAWVRGVCGVATALVTPFLGVQPLAPIMGIIAFALVYNGLLLAYVIPHRARWLRGGYLTATLDTLTISLAVATTGGVESPFYIVYYATFSIHAIRFAGRQVLVLTSLVGVGYLAAIALHGDPLVENLGVLAFRLLWGATLPIFVGVAVERARSAESSLADEIRENARLYEQLRSQMDELRTLHEQIVRAERLAAVGQLAAKVAHEINNPLAAIQMYNSLLLEDPLAPDDQRHLARSVEEQVVRAKRVVRDILDFSRPHQPHAEILRINPSVERGLSFIRHAASAANVCIREQYAEDLPPVLVDRGQFGQVLVNLATNAIDAMPRGGELIISTGLRNSEVFVQVADTGRGIQAEHLDRIFEPFFTTKAPGRGTGLGLAVCRTLVAQHHGRISVQSQPGKGTVFTVWLPPASVPEANRV